MSGNFVGGSCILPIDVPLTWEVTTQKIANKRRFTDTVLTDQKHLRLGYNNEQRKRKSTVSVLGDFVAVSCMNNLVALSMLVVPHFLRRQINNNNIARHSTILRTIKFDIRQEGTLVKIVVAAFLFHGKDRLSVDRLESACDHRGSIRNLVASTTPRSAACGCHGGVHSGATRIHCPTGVCHFKSVFRALDYYKQCNRR